MGADMMVAVARRPSYPDGSHVPVEQIVMQSDARILALTTSRVHERMDEYDVRMFLGNYVDGDVDPDDASNPVFLTLDELEMLGRALSVWVRTLTHTREVTTLSLDGKPWIVTGGLSWGDPPTECFDALTIIDALGLWDEPFTREES